MCLALNFVQVWLAKLSPTAIISIQKPVYAFFFCLCDLVKLLIEVVTLMIASSCWRSDKNVRQVLPAKKWVSGHICLCNLQLWAVYTLFTDHCSDKWSFRTLKGFAVCICSSKSMFSYWESGFCSPLVGLANRLLLCDWLWVSPHGATSTFHFIS